MKEGLARNTKIKIIVITALIFLISVVGISYAYFSIQVTGNEEASSIRVQAALLRLIYTDTLRMEGRGIYPGWSQTKTITVENTGTDVVSYDIIWRELLNEIINDELTISATCTSNINGKTCLDIPTNPIPMTTSQINNVYVFGSVYIEPNERHTYTVTVTFPEMSTDQNYNQGKSFYGTLNIRDAVPVVMDLSNFTYSVSNNEATITGYNGVIHAYDVYDVNACVASGTEFLVYEYQLEEEEASYAANELCNGRSMDGHTMSNFLEEAYAYSGIAEDLGIRVYRVDDLMQIVNKDECISNGTMLLMLGYSMDETSAAYAANELCNGREAEGMTLKSAIESRIVDSQYYESLGLPNIFLAKVGNILLPSEIDGYPVTSIGSNAFYHSNITSVVLPSTLKTIENSAFERTDLKTVVIPNGVTSIGNLAFSESSLRTVTLPNSVTSIGDGAFFYNRITSVNIPNSVTSIGSNAFEGNGFESVVIPNGVVSIGYGAFENNRLTSITIPNSVTSIGSYAFAYNRLTSVRIQGKTSPSDFVNYDSDAWAWQRENEQSYYDLDSSNIIWEGSN